VTSNSPKSRRWSKQASNNTPAVPKCSTPEAAATLRASLSSTISPQAPHTHENHGLGFSLVQTGALGQTPRQILLLDGQAGRPQPAVFQDGFKWLHTQGTNRSAGFDGFRLHDRPHQDLAVEIVQKTKTLGLGENDH